MQVKLPPTTLIIIIQQRMFSTVIIARHYGDQNFDYHTAKLKTRSSADADKPARRVGENPPVVNISFADF